MTLTYTPSRAVTIPATYTDDETGAVYAVELDDGAGSDDPRGWIGDEDVALYVYNAPWHGADREAPNNVAAETFAIYYGSKGDEEALRLTRRYLALFHGSENWQVDTFSLHGYSQSSWWDVFVAVKGDGWGTPESHAREWEMWARGDVYVVTNTVTGESLGGIYAEDEEDAVRVFREETE